MNQNFPRLKWHAHEYEYKDRSVDWYWALGIIAITGAVAAAVLSNILFAILILVGAFTLALYAVRKPNVIPYEVGERGIRIDSTLHQYTALESFWIDDEHEFREPRLFIKSDRLFMPAIVVPLDFVSPIEIREYLLVHLDEEEYIEPLPYKIMEYLGFWKT